MYLKSVKQVFSFLFRGFTKAFSSLPNRFDGAKGKPLADILKIFEMTNAPETRAFILFHIFCVSSILHVALMVSKILGGPA